MRIYLSPSNQPNNAYAGVSTNEKAEMEGVAHRVKSILEKSYNIEVVMATLSMRINKSERPTECKNKGCDFYLAIHSNAGGGGKAVGAEGFYHPNSESSKSLAMALVKELDAIAPIKSTRHSSVKSGMKAFNGAGYGEIRSPMQLGIPSVLVEVNFHNNKVIAKWIVENKDVIAAAIVRAIVKTFDIKKKEDNEPQQPTESKKLYRVQTGAYGAKANAVALAARLKSAGFDTHIVQNDNLYKVQVGAYSVKANADEMAKKLKSAGFNTYITTKSGIAVATDAPEEPPK